MKKILLGTVKTVPAVLLYACGLFVLLWDVGGGRRWLCILIAAVCTLLCYLLLRTVHRRYAIRIASSLLVVIALVNAFLVKEDFYRGAYMTVCAAVALLIPALLIALLLGCVFMKNKKRIKKHEPATKAKKYARLEPSVTKQKSEAQERRQRRREEREEARQAKRLRRQQEKLFARRKYDDAAAQPQKDSVKANVDVSSDPQITGQEDSPWRFPYTERILAAVGAAVMCLVLLNYTDMLFGNPLGHLWAKEAIGTYLSEHGNGDYRPSEVVYDASYFEYRYCCTMRVPDSADRFFIVSYRLKDEAFFDRFLSLFASGVVEDDSHRRIEEKGNTIDRLENGFQTEIRPLLQTCFVDENGYVREKDYEWIDAFIENDTEKFYLDMPFDVKNMPCGTYIKIYTELSADEAFAACRTLAVKLSALGYRIDSYTFSVPCDDGRYDLYDRVPCDVLLSAESVSDLAAYCHVDPYRTPWSLLDGRYY